MNTCNDALHEQLLDITRELIEVCREHDIQYYLSWGSCLGAVRHQDIIPWDDDVDIYIDYQDMDKLKSAFAGNSTYFYQDLDTDPESFVYWPKLRKNNTTSMDTTKKAMNMHWGICVDLFPLMHYDKPAASRMTNAKIKALAILARLPYYKKLGDRPQHKIWKALYAVLGEKYRKKFFFKLLDSINCPDGAYYLDISDVPSIIMPREDFGKGTEMPFRKLMAKVPDQYDKYLTRAYGKDYMQIPPEDSQLRYFHDTSVVDCDRDYRYYL